eukprot:1590187-Ditylum_brightwellii.AAC.1
MGGGGSKTDEDSQGEEDEEDKDDDDKSLYQSIINEPGFSSHPFDLTGDDDAPSSPPVYILTRNKWMSLYEIENWIWY